MSYERYLAGVTVLVGSGIAVVYAAVAVRRWLDPLASGALARLVEAVTAAVLFIFVLTLCGLVGALALTPVVAALVAAAAATVLGARRLAPAGIEPRRCADRERAHPAALSVAGAAVITVGAQWLAGLSASFDHGMRNYDSLSYHMPLAARMAESGSALGLHHIWQDPLPTFYPVNSELVHVFGLLAFDRHDYASLFVNLGWLALALLAGWCIGRGRAVAVASLLGVAIVAATAQLAVSQPGEAKNDIVVIALVLSAVALTLEAGRQPRLFVLAAAALGLAAGTRYAALGVVAPLLVALLALGWRHGRRCRIAVVAAALTLGAVWYARNAIQSGNPLAPAQLDLGPASLGGPESPFAERTAPAVARYLFKAEVWEGEFGPVVRANLGPLWPATLAAAMVGAVGTAAAHSRPLRALGLAGLVAAALYFVTPASAGPDGSLFRFNFRFALPALAIGLALLPLVPSLGTPRRCAGVTAVYSVLLVTVTIGGWPQAHRVGTGAVAVLAAAAVGAAWLVRQRRPGWAFAGSGLVAALAVGFGGWEAYKVYERHRFAPAAPSHPAPLARIWHWARTVEDGRIGFAGTQMNYPLFGPDGSNFVRPVGRHTSRGGFEPFATCADFRREVERQRFDFLVLTPRPGASGPPPERAFVELAWGPSAVFVGGGAYAVYAIDSASGRRWCSGSTRNAAWPRRRYSALR